MPVGTAREDVQQLRADEARKANRAGARCGAVAQDAVSVTAKRSGGDYPPLACQSPHVVRSDDRLMRVARRLRQDILWRLFEGEPERGQNVREKVDPKQLDRSQQSTGTQRRYPHVNFNSGLASKP